MTTFGGKLVNHETYQGLGDKLTSAASMIGTATTIFNAAKTVAPYIVQIGAAII
jgi:hypothetical protein